MMLLPHWNSGTQHHRILGHRTMEFWDTAPWNSGTQHHAENEQCIIQIEKKHPGKASITENGVFWKQGEQKRNSFVKPITRVRHTRTTSRTLV